MARHLQNIFLGATPPTTRLTAPHIPQAPHPVTPDVCPITESIVRYTLLWRLSRRKAPGADYLCTEMLLPIAEVILPVITLLFQLCWKWP